MKTQKTYCGLTGRQLLEMVTNDGGAVEINGEGHLLTPRVITFSNVAEISTNEDAEFIGVESRAMPEILVSINEITNQSTT